MSIRLIAFQGPSGSGKSTLQSYLDLPKVITWTSRPRRDGEVNGKDYFFTTKEQILEMYYQKEFLEITEYKGNYYGTSIASIHEVLGSDEPKTIVVDFEGAKRLKQLLNNDLVLIGVFANLEQCKRRLLYRNISREELDQRLFTYQSEIEQLSHCDLIINNSDENNLKGKMIIQILKKGIVNESHGL